jgi:hypothetical protein
MEHTNDTYLKKFFKMLMHIFPSISLFKDLDIKVPKYGTLKQVLMCEMQN